jgi:hypothetical protein
MNVGNLKWFFETTKNTFSGANDPIHETFRPHPYYSIVRESIQNSMDVILDKAKPVEMRFEILTINQVEHPELFSLKKNIESCLSFHKGNDQAKDLYGGMLKYLEENQSIKILKVSDYNTLGMSYESGNHQCPFISFMSEGISSKTSGSGGSFGFGKGAYYVPSELRTILVSTMIEDDQVYFQGRTRLASHILDGEIKGKDGVFKIEDSEPVSDINQISPIFRRTERGTDVYILGMLDDPNCGKEMVKSVLNNFWLAVHENRLDVVIKTGDVDVRFDETNLEDIMDEYFSEEIEQGLVGDIYHWNPKAYYKAVKYASQSENFLLFEDDLPTLGPVRFYVYRKEGLMNRISFMRKPAMTVNKSGRSILSGYAAVFICDNEKGNEILRQMENAAHNEWQPENVRYKQKSELGIYSDAKKELNDFIRETLKSISGVDNSVKIEISGLSEYLTIPEELLDDSEVFSGSADSTKDGDRSYLETDKETAAITSKTTKVIVKPKISVFKEEVISVDASTENGDDEIKKGGDENYGEGGDFPPDADGDDDDTGGQDYQGNMSIPIKVHFRIASIIDNGLIIHNLIVNSESQYQNVKLTLGSGTDNGEITQLEIEHSDKGNIFGNTLTNINLDIGKNIIKVKFKDNIKHTLNISAYEVR